MRRYQGSRLDQLVHEHVMGVKPSPMLDIPGMSFVSAEKPTVPPYSSDWRLALRVIEKIGPYFSIYWDGDEWEACFDLRDRKDFERYGRALVAEEAICIAALRIKGVDMTEAA